MKKSDKLGSTIALATILIFSALVIGGISGIYIDNAFDFIRHKVDDSTNYGTIKKVEDACRAMVASYTADKMRYETYVTSDSAEKQGWAEQAKIRANATAAKYNEYYLKNSFVWKGNAPNDIATELPYIE